MTESLTYLKCIKSNIFHIIFRPEKKRRSLRTMPGIPYCLAEIYHSVREKAFCVIHALFKKRTAVK